jgi:hypothetical protein
VSPVNPVNPRRPLGTRTWLVPAVSARNTWGVPAVGTNPLHPGTRTDNSPDARAAGRAPDHTDRSATERTDDGTPDRTGGTGSRSEAAGGRTWRVPATVTGETPVTRTTGGTPAPDPRLAWHVPSSVAQTTWRIPAVTGPTRAVGDDDWRATTAVTGRQRVVDLPGPRVSRAWAHPRGTRASARNADRRGRGGEAPS